MSEKPNSFSKNGKEYLKFSKATSDIGLERRTALKRAKKLGIKIVRFTGLGATNYIERSELEKFEKNLVFEQKLSETKY